MTSTLVEAELIGRAQAGDEHAYAELVGRHRTRLWSVCLRITGNEYDAEDALQEALTAAWLHLGKFRSDARFGTWAYRIAANAALAVLRRRRDVPTDLLDELDQPDRQDFTDRMADRDRIATALAGLGEQFREAIVLREYGDLTYEEIAAHQGVPVQTVKSRLNRARTAILAALTEKERS
ncbi:RNA polymerase sigma factor [Tenggerimyces flavus]|uniref:RNA polymerase sigma factor n=1 Tax=Tenggerimyces flavus TaxID=1708749 RepID=A0ABV7YAQ1_9ACTN|nr:sigma-70 family RNA polymerase sigma factor [Tenggerimyces flavus]MBM7783737.1 RNA polymerase sigma-70 factor (ECF subfamily) [Tenggerimyces flavus]